MWERDPPSPALEHADAPFLLLKFFSSPSINYITHITHWDSTVKYSKLSIQEAMEWNTSWSFPMRLNIFTLLLTRKSDIHFSKQHVLFTTLDYIRVSLKSQIRFYLNSFFFYLNCFWFKLVLNETFTVFKCLKTHRPTRKSKLLPKAVPTCILHSSQFETRLQFYLTFSNTPGLWEWLMSFQLH